VVLGNADYTLNVDTGKLGLWPGGLLKLPADSGFGHNVFKDCAPGKTARAIARDERQSRADRAPRQEERQMTAVDQRGIGKLRVLVGVLVIAALVVGYFWTALKWSYASGERAGWVQKLSRKGWVCKTWEGEMAMVSMPGSTTEKFAFTVWDESAVERINKLMGRRVNLHYEQKVGLPTSCFGETRYYVTGVTLVDEIPLAPGVVVPTPPASAPPGAPPATPK
jgi:hypothetical protein